MSEATASQEPSMEEILASIRRIISEEGQEQPGGDALSAEALPADIAPIPAAPAPAAPVPAAAAPKAQPPKPVPQPMPVIPQDEDDDDDELVLTEVVTTAADAGNNVVPLKPEAKIDTQFDLPEEHDAVEDDIELALDEPDMSEPAAMPEPVAPKAAAGTRVEPQGFDEDDFEAKPAERSAPEPRGWADPSPQPVSNPAADEFARMTEELPDLVAPEVAQAATASFAQLLQPNRRNEAPERPTGDGLLVETLVRQAVEPMLKAWLDAHLEPIVEKIVRREVERLARKAELT
ncbi:MAG TPA: DUF2497 domain-containing protein [Dongiaceae bacterium]|nr:DUF2497 domain-containing protein [Dongiaceae bacterium]